MEGIEIINETLMQNWKPFYPNFMLDPQKARISTLITERELNYKYFVCEFFFLMASPYNMKKFIQLE